jgi:phosphoglycolate phosphatase
MSGLSVEGIVFDLDATLVNLGGFVNWRGAHMQVVQAYLEEGCLESMVSRCSESGLFSMLNLMRDELCATLPQDEAERIQGRVYGVLEAFESHGASQCHIMSGCYETLVWLKKNGVKMGVATSNSQSVAENILEINKLRPFFIAVVGRSPGLRMKPHPDQILACFERLGVDPRKGAVVGDSVRDVGAAKAAGIHSIAIPTHFTKREALEKAGADQIIEGLWELPNVLTHIRF